MISSVFEERDQKKAELKSMEAKLSSLEAELLQLEDRSYQVKMIEDYLAAQYGEAQRNNPIDRSQENEIKKTIRKKKSEAKDAIEAYEKVIRKAEKVKNLNWESSVQDFSNAYGIFNAEVYLAEWEKSREAARSDKGKREWEKNKTKEYNETSKAAKKACIDELKRIFGELDVDVKIYFKKGVSKDYLTETVKLMDQIYSKGTKIGSLPASFQQKVYKWKQELNELPEDVEKQNSEQEKKAKRSKQTNLNTAKKNVSNIKQRLQALEQEIIEEEKKLQSLKEELSDAELHYIDNKEELIKKGEEKKKDWKEYYEKKKLETEEACKKEEEQLLAAIEKTQQAISEKQILREQLATEKQATKEELDKAFMLSFKKKRLLREKEEELNKRINEIDNEIEQQQSKLATQEQSKQRIQPDRKIDALEKELEVKITTEDDKTNQSIGALDKWLLGLKNEITLLEKTIPSSKKEKELLKQKLEKEETEVQELERYLKDFHSEYLISKYGKDIGIQSLIRDKKRELKETTQVVNKLQKEVEKLDKAAREAEIDRERQAEEQRRVQAEQAKEQERIRKEQEERRNRISRELSKRDDEQELISTKETSLKNISIAVQEMEQNPEHALLKKDTWPLDDDGRRVVTNSIVRKQYTQISVTAGCNDYLLVFVDHNGNAISEKRLIKQKPVGEETKTSFELKAEGGFTKENYYLVLINFDTSEIISAQRYKINIAFANDFDF